MPFVLITLGGLVLGPSPRPDVDHVSVALIPTPNSVWLSRFASFHFSPPSMSVALGSVGKPVVNGSTVEFDAYIPQAAGLISELKSAVADTNAWYAGVHEPALAAKAASDAAATAQRAERQAQLNALLVG